jgi:hypothetical protein
MNEIYNQPYISSYVDHIFLLLTTIICDYIVEQLHVVKGHNFVISKKVELKLKFEYFTSTLECLD